MGRVSAWVVYLALVLVVIIMEEVICEPSFLPIYEMVSSW